MSFVTCEVCLAAMINSVLTKTGGVADGWELKLYSNNHDPDPGDSVSDYTEVAGGGYADKNLSKANFVVTPGSPAEGEYNAFQDFTFTGATSAPSTVYGYFLVDGDGNLIGAERFTESILPFVPVNGSLLRIKPLITFGDVS